MSVICSLFVLIDNIQLVSILPLALLRALTHPLNATEFTKLKYYNAKLLQKSEMRKDIVIELSYKGFG